MALIGVGDQSRQVSWTAWAYGHPNKGTLDRLQSKLTATRTPIHVKAGTGAKTFVDYTVSKAIYATGWDNNVVLEADAAGHWNKVEKVVTPLVPALVNINTATLSELQTLPGIGATKAQAIIDFRTNHGNFTSIDQLDDVPGIGPATINLVRPYVRI
jgi:competence ComEA-like helix-hairpin-helix protein